MTLLSRGVMGWVNKVGKKIKDSRGFCLIINGFIIARLDKTRLTWAISNYHRLSMDARAEREPGPPMLSWQITESIRQFFMAFGDIPPSDD